MKKIEFIDLARQQKRIRAELDKRISSLLDAGDYILGKEIEELENKLCAYTGSRYCISCSSGSAGLIMSVMALSQPKGTPVIVPAFSFFASVEMPVLAGMKPIFVDIDPEFFQISPQELEKAIRINKIESGIVIPVDLFGQAAPYNEIFALTEKYGLYTLEDAAQAFGASYINRKTCNLGCDLAVTSFFPAKPLGCYGDGGAIFTNNADLAARLFSIRVHGQGDDKYNNARLGINGRLDTLQAAVLLAKLEIFNDEIEKRNSVAQMYNKALKDIPGLRLPLVAPSNTNVWAQYCVLLPKGKRDAVKLELAQKGVPTHIYYPKPLPYLPAFENLRVSPDAFPVATEVAQRILALPFHPYLENEDIQYIATVLAGALQ